jgi:hypothetical protein
MVISVFKSGLVFPVILYAALQKTGMVILAFAHFNQPWAAGFRQVIVPDGLYVLYGIVYFYTISKQNSD